MLKILLKAAFLLVAISSSDLTACVREGFYCGAGFGDSIDHYSQKASGIAVINRSRTLDHLAGTAFAGFGYTLCNFYMAAEIGTYFPKRSMTIERPGANFIDSTFLTTTSVQDFVTGDILLGFRPDNTFLCYLRGGVSYSRLSFFQFTNELENVSALDRSKKGAALRLGAGINYAITSCFGIGLDYIFTSYSSLSFTTKLPTNFKVKGYSNYIGISGIFSF